MAFPLAWHRCGISPDASHRSSTTVLLYGGNCQINCQVRHSTDHWVCSDHWNHSDGFVWSSINAHFYVICLDSAPPTSFIWDQWMYSGFPCVFQIYKHLYFIIIYVFASYFCCNDCVHFSWQGLHKKIALKSMIHIIPARFEILPKSNLCT